MGYAHRSSEPIIVGDSVLIRSSYGNLFSLNIETGALNWDRPVQNVSELVAAFGGRVYLTTLSGSLGVIDLKTGDRVGVFRDIRPTRLLVNRQTDRLYLVSDSGEVQCLREEGSELPTFNVQPEIQMPDEEAEVTTPAPKAPTTDPFGGGGADPFGGGAPGGNDPFGGGAPGGNDPFGGGAGGNDPFGGGNDAGNDPFGANPF